MSPAKRGGCRRKGNLSPKDFDKSPEGLSGQEGTAHQIILPRPGAGLGSVSLRTGWAASTDRCDHTPARRRRADCPASPQHLTEHVIVVASSWAGPSPTCWVGDRGELAGNPRDCVQSQSDRITERYKRICPFTFTTMT